MKKLRIIGLAAFLVASITQASIAQVGKPGIHDPSTIVEDNGKYYSFGTGGNGIISEDGWKWHGGGDNVHDVCTHIPCMAQPVAVVTIKALF